MGAGSYAAGLGPAGHDPVPDASNPQALQTGAVFFDPRTKNAVLLSDGTFQATHPVDQAAALAISLVLGTVGSVPTAGSSLADIAYTGADLEAQVTNRVNLALAKLLDAKDIDRLAVSVERIEGGFVMSVDYHNLRIIGRPVRSLKVTG
jgi:hypothetical protein